ncbi:MAG: carbamoyltransferase [Planctomycetota bacterium]|jgi:carbamoyltransferase
MKLLGISAFHRDAAAALLIDGKVVAAMQEDRFTKRLQDESFPIRAARSCLAQANLNVSDLDGIVFYEKPLRKFERILASQLGAFPKSASSFSQTMFTWLGDRLWMKNRIADELEFKDTSKIYFTEHQMAHAAGAFYSSPFDEAAVLTIDDAGEWATSILVKGTSAGLEQISEVRFPHSLGLFVSAVAQYLGLEPGAQDHLIEALAPYGTPKYLADFEKLVIPDKAGSFAIKLSAFRYAFDHKQLFTDELVEILGPARIATNPLRFNPEDSRDADIAASLQAVIEKRGLELCAELHRKVPSDNLCFAGRLAENRSLNARILRDGPFSKVYVPPCPDKAGAAVGAALYVHHTLTGDTAHHVLMDPFLGAPIDKHPEDGAEDLTNVHDTMLECLLKGERIGWARGRLELGGHSLGHRSLLADPRPEDARSQLLETVQHGEPFLPIRLAVTVEEAGKYFDLSSGGDALYHMAQAFAPATDALKAHAPSAIRPDGSAWPQLVDKDSDPDFHRLLTSFAEKSGAPILLHSTLSLRGSPIARVEGDAFDAFKRSSLDSLIVEDRIYQRS